MAIPISYNVRSLFVRKTTTIATAAGIGLVVFVLASCLMMGAGIRNTLAANGAANRVLVLRKGSDAEMQSAIEGEKVSLLTAAPGIKKAEDGHALVSPEVVVVIALDKEGEEVGMVTNLLLRGVTPGAMEIRPEVRIVAGHAPRPGTREAMVGASIVEGFKALSLGSQLELRKGLPVEIVGVFESGGSSLESEIWTDIDVLRAAYGRGNASSSFTAVLSSPEAFDGFAAYAEGEKQLKLLAQKETVYYEKLSEGSFKFVLILGGVISFLFSVGAMIGAMITMYGAVAQRSKEVGTLRALGFSRGAVLTSFLLESTVLALIGAGLGALAGLGLTVVKFSMLNFSTWQEISFSFDASPATVLVPMAAGAVMGIFGGLLPALHAARMPPVQAMRG